MEGTPYAVSLFSVAWRLGLMVGIVALVAYSLYSARKRFPIVRELAQFVMARKLWWMTPMLVVFLFLALLIVTTESSTLMYYIYVLF